MNVLIDKLPRTVRVADEDYEVRWGFRTFLLIEELMEEEELTDEAKLYAALNLFYINVPEDRVEAARRLIEFHNGGSSPDEAETSQKDVKSARKVLHYGHDHERIFTAFLRSYDINLARVEDLHWYEFKAMFQDLSEDCILVKVIGYRSMNINQIKDKEQRKFYTEMKKRYALPLSKSAKEELRRVEQALLGDGDLTKR